MATPRVLIADDHPLVREGLATAIGGFIPGFAIDCTDCIVEAETMARRSRDYRLMLLDYRLPDADGFSGLFRMQHALGALPIAVISAYDSVGMVAAARAIGAAGFLTKSEPLDRLVHSVERLLQGECVFPPTVEADAGLAALNDKPATLSPAQMRVLSALSRGRLNKQIAQELDLAEPTVKAHMTGIFRELGVANRLQAMLAVRPLFAPED